MSSLIIIKKDSVVQRIRENLRKFKLDIMRNANIKLKIWEEGRKETIRKLK